MILSIVSNFSLFQKIGLIIGSAGIIPIALIVAKWGLFLVLGFLLFLFRVYFSIYQGFRIFLDILVLTVLKLYGASIRTLTRLFRLSSEMILNAQKMALAIRYEDWSKYYEANESLRHVLEGKNKTESFFPSLEILVATTNRLNKLRLSEDYSVLMYDIPSIVKRNYLGIDDIVLHDRHASASTVDAIRAFNIEITNCIDSICSSSNNISVDEKIRFLRKLSRNIGHSALCLSGGGAITMYHMGVLKALIETGLYRHIHVVSGASGGAITAAMCAMCTEEELLRDAISEYVSTDYRQDGSMRRGNISWFPPLYSQAIHFLKTGYLVDNVEFCRTTEYYYGNVTFEEAYNRTHKHVCIAVTASNTGGNSGSTTEKLLLNHLSTPHVLIRSAVAATCALPGIMKPNRLLCKSKSGEIVPFESDGSHWVDGSIGADLPFKRMSALFSVSNFIVSQVNFHVVPFVSHRTPGAAST